MFGWLFGRGERRPRSRLVGCLLWILALIVLLIVLSLLFGGFRKGTKAAGAGLPRQASAAVSSQAAAAIPGPVQPGISIARPA
jgi:cytochrome c-type biogenesis protein CcmH/NrfF